MWDAVVAASDPEKLAETANVCRAVSRTTSANPVPGEVLGGLSAGPVNVATYSTGVARAALPMQNAAMRAKREAFMRPPEKVNSGTTCALIVFPDQSFESTENIGG